MYLPYPALSLDEYPCLVNGEKQARYGQLRCLLRNPPTSTVFMWGIAGVDRVFGKGQSLGPLYFTA